MKLNIHKNNQGEEQNFISSCPLKNRKKILRGSVVLKIGSLKKSCPLTFNFQRKFYQKKNQPVRVREINSIFEKF